MAPATETRSALIVAHGSPSSPEGPEQAIRTLARRVTDRLPGWTVEGTTLAAKGSLEAALAAVPERLPLIFPFFMSDGWFVREKLPQRIRKSHSAAFEMLDPLGLDSALHALCLRHAREAAAAAGLATEKTALLLAAHGSPSDPGPSRAVARAARFIAAAQTFREVRVGFIDETPFLAEAARIDGPALCLPFFALRAGHVDIDLPTALAAASFRGSLLDPIGLHPGVAGLVRSALLRHAARCAA